MLIFRSSVRLRMKSEKFLMAGIAHISGISRGRITLRPSNTVTVVKTSTRSPCEERTCHAPPRSEAGRRPSVQLLMALCWIVETPSAQRTKGVSFGYFCPAVNGMILRRCEESSSECTARATSAHVSACLALVAPARTASPWSAALAGKMPPQLWCRVAIRGEWSSNKVMCSGGIARRRKNNSLNTLHQHLACGTLFRVSLSCGPKPLHWRTPGRCPSGCSP